MTPAIAPALGATDESRLVIALAAASLVVMALRRPHSGRERFA